jgi:hypothetical protein
VGGSFDINPVNLPDRLSPESLEENNPILVRSLAMI